VMEPGGGSMIVSSTSADNGAGKYPWKNSGMGVWPMGISWKNC
jgi:hypothetical protein